MRSAEARDAAAVARVHHAAWEAAYRGVISDALLDSRPLERRIEMWHEHFARGEPPGATLVAESEGCVVGFAALEPVRSDDLDPDAALEVKALYVHPARWRDGIGRLLLDGARETATAAGCSLLVLWVFARNAPARAFYEAVGWQADGAEGEWEGERVVRYRTAL